MDLTQVNSKDLTPLLTIFLRKQLGKIFKSYSQSLGHPLQNINGKKLFPDI